jgi:phosphoserine phosphatase
MKYKALISSDWNECLAPCGPFDPISFTYPDLEPELSGIFAKYTGNEIALAEAIQRISALLPAPLTIDQMDAYLDACFVTYSGVPDLIEWCLNHGILFVINTTGTQGYFQRVFSKNLIPDVPFVAANPLIRFLGAARDPHFLYQVTEIEDKAKNTESMMRLLGISPRRVVVMGDSGGDGPHFKWGYSTGAFLIGSMIKPSLETYCRQRRIIVHERFGLSYSPGEERDRSREMQTNFMELTESLSAVLDS